tara:strand:+ start:225 stop:1175 length:951 start_codon:yes stop_codon:yes gene_type:complete
MSPIYLKEDEVNNLITVSEAINILENATIARSQGKIWNQPRYRLPIRNGNYNFMSASWPEKNIVGHKSYTAGKNGASFHNMLYGCEGEGLLAIIESNRLGQIRTGAASGLASKFLSRKSSSTLGVIGTGYQSETQIEAICSVREISKIKIFSRNKEKRELFKQKMTKILGDRIIISNSLDEVSDGIDILVTITNSVNPVVTSEMILEGLHINAAGNNSWMKSEIDIEAFNRFNIIVTDDIDQSKIECGELIRAVERGYFSWDKVIQLDSVISGSVQGRKSNRDITLFESQGIALEDLAVSEFVYKRAIQNNIGLQI